MAQVGAGGGVPQTSGEVLEVTPAELAKEARALGTLADELTSGVRALDEHISGLLGDSWSGDASAAFDGVWQQWHEGAAKVVSGLSTMSELMAACAQGFAAADGG